LSPLLDFAACAGADASFHDEGIAHAVEIAASAIAALDIGRTALRQRRPRATDSEDEKKQGELRRPAIETEPPDRRPHGPLPKMAAPQCVFIRHFFVVLCRSDSTHTQTWEAAC
jgi:hypothetical protein